MNENTNYKFGENQASVYSGKQDNIKPKISFLKKFGVLNFVCLFFTLFLVANIINSIAVEMNIQKQTKDLEAERSTVLAEHDKLKKQIKFYKSNEGVEKLARDSLGLIKSNEVPVRYIDKK